MLFRWVEIFVLTTLVVTYGDLSFYTWWGITGYLLCSATIASGYAQTWLIDTSTVVSCSIACVLPICSTIKCTVFETAYGNHGLLTYAWGNAMLHYWPALRCFANLPFRDKPSVRLGGVRVMLMYMHLHDTSVTYGCPTTNFLMMLAGVLGASTLDALLQCVYD
jgi:hypothetical protein